MRFSLRTLLVAVLILALALIAALSQWELRKTRAELMELRDKHGELVVRDESLVGIRTKVDFEGALYKIEVFVPEGVRYQLAYGFKQIPVKGAALDEQTLGDLDPGTNVITVKKREKGDTVTLDVEVKSPTHSKMQATSMDAASWIKKQNMSTEFVGMDGTEAVHAGPVITLVRGRLWKVLSPTNSAEDPEPTAGVLLELKQVNGK